MITRREWLTAKKSLGTPRGTLSTKEARELAALVREGAA